MLLQRSCAAPLCHCQVLGVAGPRCPHREGGPPPPALEFPHKFLSRQPRVTANYGMKPHPGRCHTWTPICGCGTLPSWEIGIAPILGSLFLGVGMVLGGWRTNSEEELWETRMRSVLDETPMAQLVQDIAHQMGNVSGHGAAELQRGHQVVSPNLHQEQERTQDVHPQPENILVLQEVMEKLQRVNQSLELMLMALEDAQSRLEKHLEHLKAIPDLDGHWLVASACRGVRRIQPVVPREKPRYRLTSTPERECDMELLQEELDKMEMSCLQEPSYLEQPQEVAGDIPGFTGCVSPDPGSQRTTPSSCGVTPELVMDAGKLLEPKPCSPRSNTSPCQGLTRAGQRCRKKAIPGQEFCHIHTTSSSLAMD